MKNPNNSEKSLDQTSRWVGNRLKKKHTNSSIESNGSNSGNSSQSTINDSPELCELKILPNVRHLRTERVNLWLAPISLSSFAISVIFFSNFPRSSHELTRVIRKIETNENIKCSTVANMSKQMFQKSFQ